MIAILRYNDLECLEYFPIATYFFKLNNEQYNSLKFIQESLLHKKYIDIDDNFMYLRFIVSDWFSKLNLNNKFEIANFINKLNFIIDNYKSDYDINQIIFILAECHLHLNERDTWLSLLKKIKSKYPKGGPVEASTYINYHKMANQKIDVFDIARISEYKINNKLTNYDLNIFYEYIDQLFDKYEINPIEEILNYRDKLFQKESKKNILYFKFKYFIPSRFIFHNYNMNDINNKNFNLELQDLNYNFFICKSDLFYKYRTIIREAENLFRKDFGLKPVGQAWVSETILFNQLKENFPDLEIIQHGKPSFLGKQHYDIWVPKYKIAVEYHGLQHFQPVNFFGGEEAFVKNQIRDLNKIKISADNNVKLIVVSQNYDLKEIIEQINLQIYARQNINHNQP